MHQKKQNEISMRKFLISITREIIPYKAIFYHIHLNEISVRNIFENLVRKILVECYHLPSPRLRWMATFLIVHKSTQIRFVPQAPSMSICVTISPARPYHRISKNAVVTFSDVETDSCGFSSHKNFVVVRERNAHSSIRLLIPSNSYCSQKKYLR
jgi:hypothetical protein